MHLQIFEICAVIIVLSALFGYLNARFLKLPNTIGLNDRFYLLHRIFIRQHDLSLIFSLTRLINSSIKSTFRKYSWKSCSVFCYSLVQCIPILTNSVSKGGQSWFSSTLGVLASTLICGVLTYFGFRLLSIEPKFIHCLLFGALISPTDPIAVLGILKPSRGSKKTRN